MAQVQESFPGQRTAGNGVHGGPLALVNSGLFADASNFDLRYVPDYERIRAIVGALRTLGLKVVLTSGSFDILHEGHSMYLEAARHFGDFLIVGLDSDEKIKARKGPHRPAVPEMERLRMVTHQRGVGLVTLKHLHDERWRLIKTIRPDVLVATADTYSRAEIAELEERYCGRVEVLDRMATVSTSARLRRIQLGLPEPGPDEGGSPQPGQPQPGQPQPGQPRPGGPAAPGGAAQPGDPPASP
jgi:D-glycero-beta-D-manno-heptose 1-phosphate adenylyltransferase